MEAFRGCVQIRHKLKAVQSKMGLVCSFVAGFTALHPAQVTHGKKVWPNVPG